MNVINSDAAPKAVGPYSQAIEANGFVFCSGQIGLEPQTGNLVEGLENQTRQIMKNIQAVLAASGLDLAHVVKTTIFLTNIADFATVNSIYGEYFAANKPARSTIAVASLPKNALIEIEVTAAKKA